MIAENRLCAAKSANAGNRFCAAKSVNPGNRFCPAKSVNAGSAAYFLSSKRTRTVLPPLNPACRHPSQGGKTNYPGRGVDRKKPLYRPQWLSTAAYKGFGLQLLTTIYSGSISQFSLLKAVLCFLLPALTQRFTYSECIVRNISHILNTPLHAFRIQHLTCSVYIASRIPNTTSHVFRIHHFTRSVYIASRFPNTTFHSFPIFLYSKMYCVTIPPVLYRGPKISYTVSCSMGEVKYNIRGLLICTGGQIHHVRFYFKR